MEPGVCSSLPWLFCACPPFPDFDNFKQHFIEKYLSSYSFAGSWSDEEGLCVVKLVLFIEIYYAIGKRKINIHVSDCNNCDSSRVKSYKESNAY